MKLSSFALAYFVFGASLPSSSFVTAAKSNSPINNSIRKSLPNKSPLSNTQQTSDDSSKSKMSYPSWTLKCTDVPQFDALEAAAASFRTDDKLHLRNLCNDSTRCNGLIAYHHSNHRLIHLDYSRQQVTGEVMELLYVCIRSSAFPQQYPNTTYPDLTRRNLSKLTSL